MTCRDYKLQMHGFLSLSELLAIKNFCLVTVNHLFCKSLRLKIISKLVRAKVSALRNVKVFCDCFFGDFYFA